MKTLMAAVILVHSWYPVECCNGEDCHPVPCDSLVETQDGYVWEGILFIPSKVKPSQDKTCHVCVGSYNGMPMPHCAFIQASA